MKKIIIFTITTLMLACAYTAPGPRYKRVFEVDKWNKGLLGYDKVYEKYSHTHENHDHFNLFCHSPGIIRCRLQKMIAPPNSNDPIISPILEKYSDFITDIFNKMIALAEKESESGNREGNSTRKFSNEDLTRLNLIFVFFTKWDYIDDSDGKQTIEFSIVEL